MNNNNTPKSREDPLFFLDEIEKIEVILNDSELRLVNNIFEKMDDFYLITDSFEHALSKKVIDELDLRTLYNIILKVVNTRNKMQKEEKKKKQGFLRTFFELPEIIYEFLSSTFRSTLSLEN